MQRLLERALAGLPEGDARLFFALAVLPEESRSSGAIARLVGEAAPGVAAKLWRLARRGLLLVADSGAGSVYELDAGILQPARDLAPSRSR